VRLAGARPGGLDHIRVDGALRQEAHATQLVGLLLEHIDECAADDLALGLGVAHPGERREEARLGIDADYVHSEMLRKGFHHLPRFAKAQQPVIYEYARELIADGAMQERCDYRGVDPAGETEQDLTATHPCAHALDGIGEDVAGAPERIRAADLAHEALEQASALGGVGDFGVKLYPVETPPFIAHGGERNGAGAGAGGESRRQRVDPIAMTHPHIEHAAPGGIAAVLELIEQARGAGDRDLGVAELPLAGGGDATAELLCHGLHAVADTEHRHAELEHRGRGARRVGRRDRLGSAGEDHAARPERTHLRITHVPRVDLAVDAELADAPGDQLRVLRPEIEDQDALCMDIGLRRGGGWCIGCRSRSARHWKRVRTPGSWAPPW
jgi:hypothetical protein